MKGNAKVYGIGAVVLAAVVIAALYISGVSWDFLGRMHLGAC